MKLRFTNNLFFSLIILVSFGLLTSNSGGKMGVTTTGCGGGGCHGSSASSTTGVFILFDGNSNLTQYTPGKKYAITLSISNSSFSGNSNAKGGFDINFSNGSISNVPANTMLMSKELHHTSPKALSSGATNYTFDWTAPASGSGGVTINAAANIVNGDGGTSGDAWNKTQVSLTEATTAAVPSVTNMKSQSITTTSATISASVNANGASTTAEVQYGTTTSYGSTKAVSPSSITGTTNTSVSASLTGLTPNTTYHYRIKATNSAGTTNSADSTFRTSSSGSAIIASSKSSHTELLPNYIQKGQIFNLKSEAVIKDVFAFNTNGKKIRLNILSSQNNTLTLSSEGLSRGIYYVEIITDKGVADILKLHVE